MSFLKKLFAKPTPPEPFTDPILGQLNWFTQDEGWQGQYNGFNFFIGDCGTDHPDEPVLAYTREILNDPTLLNASLAQAKARHKANLSEKLRQFYTPEIDELTWDVLYFSVHKGKRTIFATLKPGRDYRSWRIEFTDRQCDGLGFDT